MSGRIILWRPVPFADGWDLEPDAVEWIDVGLFDASWGATDQWIGPGGVGQLDHRYRKFGAWIARGLTVDMCHIALNDGEATFGNGRHRFAWLRDHGLIAIPVQVSPASSNECARRFGSALRECLLPD